MSDVEVTETFETAPVEVTQPHWVKTALGAWGTVIAAVSVAAPVAATMGVDVPVADVNQIGVLGSVLISGIGTAVGAGMMLVAKARALHKKITS